MHSGPSDTVSESLKVAILIPALNAAETIVDLIRDVERFIPREHIIVVDDGSTDGTGRLALDAGTVVLSHDQNAGKGAALQTGFRHVLEGHFDGVIVIDADGQHEPRFIPDFIGRAALGDADILIGSRMDAVGEMPWIRQLTNRITSACVSALAGQRIPDSQSGYRYVGENVLRNLRLKTSRYETESEMLIQAGRRGYRIASIPISSVYGAEESAIRPIRDTLRFVCLMLKSAFTFKRMEKRP